MLITYPFMQGGYRTYDWWRTCLQSGLPNNDSSKDYVVLTFVESEAEK